MKMASRLGLSFISVMLHLAFVQSRRLQSQPQFAFLAIGDQGGILREAQTNVANQMDVYASRHNAELVVGVGDNFYYKGVASTSDEKWEKQWRQVYKENNNRLKYLPWHMVLGNHDYCGNVKAQLDYKDNGWRMDDFHWIHRFEKGGQKFAFVYIDTNLLAYGRDTKEWLRRDCPNMERQFGEFESKDSGWTQQGHLQRIGGMLDHVQDADWILVFGHHPVGGSRCGGEGRTSELRDLFRDKRVSAYIYGHVHALGYGQTDGVSHVLTGGGSDRDGQGCSGNGGRWGQDKIAGFVSINIYDSYMSMIYVDEYGHEVYHATQWRR